MKIIVTGGAGFIGSHLVDALVIQGHEVHVIDDLSSGSKENLNKDAIFHELDICDPDIICPIFSGVDIVFHLAANARLQQSIVDPVNTNETNVTGMLSVFTIARDSGVKRIVYAASCSAYGDTEADALSENLLPLPQNPYAVQKYVGELYARAFSKNYDIETVSLRFFNVYGTRQSSKGAYAPVIPIFIEAKNSGKPLPVVGDGEQTRDFIHVSDIVRALMLASISENVGRGEVINLGTGIETSVNKIASLVGGEVAHLPARKEMRRARADNSLAKKLLGFTPEVSIEEGVKEML